MGAESWSRSLTLAVLPILSQDKALCAPARIEIPVVHTYVLTAVVGRLADILPWGKRGEMKEVIYFTASNFAKTTIIAVHARQRARAAPLRSPAPPGPGGFVI